MPLLLVEGPFDRRVVLQLLGMVGIDSVEVVECRSLRRVAENLRTLGRSRSDLGALIDADEITVRDAQEHARDRLGTKLRHVYAAVPTLEAWLLADTMAVPELSSIVGNPALLADEIPKPKAVARQVFGDTYRRYPRPALPDGYDVRRAMARSPSLRVFVDGMRTFADSGEVHEPLPTTADRVAVIAALKEVADGSSVMWRTMSSEYTAEQLIDSMNAGEEAGTQYAQDLLRIARDLLRRSAERQRGESS